MAIGAQRSLAKGKHPTIERKTEGDIQPPTPERKTIRVLPLSEIPPSHELEVSPAAEETASHELNHALCALVKGVPVSGLSVIPEGNSLGRTTFGGHISHDAFMVIAMGGSVSTHMGEAQGDGSDRFQASYLSNFTNTTVGQARAEAVSIINAVPMDVRRRASRIIAHMGSIHGSLIPTILRQARAEIEMEQEENKDKMVFVRSTKQASDYIVEPEDQTEEKTTIENLDNNQSMIRYTTGEKVDVEITICTICGGENGHREGCEIKKKKEESNLQTEPRYTSLSEPQG